MAKEDDSEKPGAAPVTRRDFLRGTAAGALTGGLLSGGLLGGAEGAEGAETAETGVVGPGKVPVSLLVNGTRRRLELEPRVTLLDAIRDRLDLTGSKKVCDRGTCGACTVFLDGKPVYACSILAIEANERNVETIESLGTEQAPGPVQAAFVANDAQQCGFCTPGFVMACEALLRRHSNPTSEQMESELGGNLCRCGTYAGIRRAVADAASARRGGGREMADPSWPAPAERTLLGKRTARLDGPAKATGAARYSYDVNRPGMLHAQMLRCPHAHARVKSIDTTAAEKLPGVKAVRVLQGPGTEIQWALDEIAIVAATTEEGARDALRAIRVAYDVLPHFVSDERLEAAPDSKPADEDVTGDPDRAFAAAEVTIEGTYGAPAIAHCCLEPHGQVCEWEDENHLTAWCSTQGVSALASEFADALDVPASNVRVLTPYMGGGFGSKFSPDRWGIECAKLARELRAPVKLMLDRDAELTVAGDRPSVYARIKAGAKRDGTLTAWASESWGSGGLAGSGSPPVPYVLQAPDRRHRHTSVPTHRASARAWRAPNHPQACFLTFAALEDLAAAIPMDPVDFLAKNLHLAGDRSKIWAEELRIGAERIEWKKKWHARGAETRGVVKRGLGVSLHTWGGRGHRSACEVVVYPDGVVEAKIASQDLGTGTRTVIGVVVAETFGLPITAVRVSLGDSRLPPSGGSGGSSTVGGVSAAARRAAVAARQAVFERVAKRLDASADTLEAVGGAVRVKGSPSKSLPWKQVAAALGVTPITATGANPGEGKLNDSGVGGIQMAEVSVDSETGVVRVETMVAVQDCGLIVDLTTAESQVYGGMIMGISYALFEEKLLDPHSGRMLNANLEFYKLAGLADVGNLIVHMMTGPGYDDRGVIGLGEPPVISPGAAISNAVANAIGVRVPRLPITPRRVLDALDAKRSKA